VDLAVVRIGVARLWHEANSFCTHTMTRADFQAREWLRGEAVPAFYAGTATEIGGFLDWVGSGRVVELVFSRCAAAPGGPVAQDLLDDFTEEVVGEPEFDGVDDLYLSLHGACLGSEDLAGYTAERHPIGQRWIAASERTLRAVQTTGPIDVALRNLVVRVVGNLPALQARLLRPVAGLRD
jgi:hypothetical protein